MRVTVNGEPREISSASVDALLGEIDYEGTHFAIAVNFDVLPKLHERIIAAGGTIRFNSEPAPSDIEGLVIDCRGLSARDAQTELRGVKGELILIESSEVQLARPVRLIHPRWPLYVIPRGGNRFMLGATSI